MIPVETWYKTYVGKFLAIIEVFKTQRHYIKGCKSKVLLLTDHNNLHHFIDTRNLSFKEVCWVQTLFQYYFRINYCQGKANGAANAFSKYFWQSAKEKSIFRVKNTKILYCLHFSLAKVSELLADSISFFYQVFIYSTVIISWICQFWTTLWEELFHKR